MEIKITKRVKWMEAMRNAIELKETKKVKALCCSVVNVMEDGEGCGNFCPFCPTCDWIENVTGYVPSDFDD